MSAPDDPRPRGVPEGSALLMKTWSDGEAEVVRALLASYGIPCLLTSDITHAVVRVNLDGLGEIRIFVPESSLEEASALIAEHLREGLEPVPGGDEAEKEEEDETGSGGTGTGGEKP